LATDLSILSLYAYGCWGWHPRVALPKDSDLRNVIVLALGGYVFSHQEQVDWVASLDLRKLYLDRCRVLFEACCATPWEVLKKSNSRYPTIDYLKRVSTTKTSGYNTRNGLDGCNPDQFQTLQFPL
jgi:hypothetical protein